MAEAQEKCSICGKNVLAGRLLDHLRVGHAGEGHLLFEAEQGWTCPLGHANLTASAFCTTCGGARPSPVSSPRHCPHGHVLSPEDRFCPRCGQAPAASGPLVDSDHVPWRFVVPGVFGLALLVAVAIWVSRGGHLATGDDVASHTEDWVTANYSRPVSGVDCPDGDLDDGDSVICQIAFIDGDFVNVKVTVAGDRGDVRYYEELAP